MLWVRFDELAETEFVRIERIHQLANELNPFVELFPPTRQLPARGVSTAQSVHNAVGGAFGDFLSIDPAVLERNFQVNTMGLLHLARLAAPPMIEAGKGAIVCTGNTSTYRGKASFAGFAPTKAAQRILAESMARHLGPKGVHVAYVAIDAVIDVPWTRKRMPQQPDAFFCKPADIAAECWHIAHQPRSAWTFDVTIRPDREPW